MQQFEQQVLVVFAHVARFGQRCCVTNSEGDVERTCERLGKQRLAGAGGTDEQDIGFVQLDGCVFFSGTESLVVVVHCDGQGIFAVFWSITYWSRNSLS